MATKKQTDMVEAAVLRDCVFGKAGEVVELSVADAEIGSDNGMLDLHQSAVKALRAAAKAA
jgi:hypothetical protein